MDVPHASYKEHQPVSTLGPSFVIVRKLLSGKSLLSPFSPEEAELFHQNFLDFPVEKIWVQCDCLLLTYMSVHCPPLRHHLLSSNCSLLKGGEIPHPPFVTSFLPGISHKPDQSSRGARPIVFPPFDISQSVRIILSQSLVEANLYQSLMFLDIIPNEASQKVARWYHLNFLWR